MVAIFGLAFCLVERPAHRGDQRSRVGRVGRNDRDALTSYTDSETLREAGQGGFEIRTLTAVAGACEGQTGEIWFCQPIPIFATSGFVGVMDVRSAAEAKAA